MSAEEVINTTNENDESAETAPVVKSDVPLISKSTSKTAQAEAADTPSQLKVKSQASVPAIKSEVPLVAKSTSKTEQAEVADTPSKLKVKSQASVSAVKSEVPLVAKSTSKTEQAEVADTPSKLKVKSQVSVSAVKSEVPLVAKSTSKTEQAEVADTPSKLKVKSQASVSAVKSEVPLVAKSTSKTEQAEVADTPSQLKVKSQASVSAVKSEVPLVAKSTSKTEQAEVADTPSKLKVKSQASVSAVKSEVLLVAKSTSKTEQAEVADTPSKLKVKSQASVSAVKSEVLLVAKSTSKTEQAEVADTPSKLKVKSQASVSAVKSEVPLVAKSTSKTEQAEAADTPSQLKVKSKSSVKLHTSTVPSEKGDVEISKSVSDTATREPKSRSSGLTLSKQQLSPSKDSKLQVTSSRISSTKISEEVEEQLGSDEEVVEEEEEEDLVNFPYGKRYEEITPRRLKEIALELGLIKLYWPEILVPDVDQKKHYPKSYVENNNKEKLLLWYTENFRKQYQYVYKDRKPLFIAADNECGLQKMVCTTIRPSIMRFPEFKTWEGCANFVADHLEFEPLENPQQLPERLYSPSAVLERQKGNIFEYSTLLSSFLIAAGYDAYVASGYATQEFCHFNQKMITCPFLPDFSKKEEEVKDEGIPKYMIKAPLDLRSKFLLEMDEREEKKIRDKIEAKEEEERLAIEEFEKPAPDDIFGTRIHSWVVVLPCQDIEEAFFIDTLTGNKCELSHPSFLGLESLWNHTNYWVNLQDCKEGCKNLKFDLTDLECWEHVLPGEPWFLRKSDVREEDEITPDIILMEKHLDMPSSWVQKLDISNSAYENRFPAGVKTAFYKKTKLEQFAPYVQEDGLVMRITTYEDYDWTDPLWVYEYYSNRVDCMTEIRRNVLEKSILEIFRRGREDCLKEHFYYENGVGVEDERTLEFFHMAHLDGLEKLEMHPLYLIEHFRDREDFLYFRKVDYEPRGLAAEEGPKRIVLKLVEQFNRNSEKEADEDIARRIFAVADNQILLKFHYAPNKVTAATREFIKPKLSEMGDRLTFNPDLTAGYQTYPTDKPPKRSYLFRLLEEQLKAEEDSLRLVRKMEDDIVTLLELRVTEMMEPQLSVSIYNMERNTLAIAAMKEVDKIMHAAEEAKKGEVELDYLAPYFARIGNPETVTYDEAVKILDNCRRDFKQMLVDRINKTQGQFETLAMEIAALNTWYKVEQDNLTPAEEIEYFKKTEVLTFNLHVLEIRINRFRDLAPARYAALESLIKSHPKLVKHF